MSMWFELILIVVGIAIMLRGADILVTKAEKFGHAKGWSPILVGVLVVGVGTSLPEFMVGVLAAAQGHPLLAAANVIGSNITNIGLIVGLAAILGEIHLSNKTINYDIPLSIVPIGVFVFGYIFNSSLTSTLGIFLLLAYLGYIGIMSREYERQRPNKQIRPKQFTSTDLCLLLIGLGMLLGGAELTLRNSELLFSKLGMSELVVGAVILALGTSLPELVATLTAVIKKEGQIAVGNVLGSNVFNILVVMGTASLIAPIEIPKLIYEIVFLGVISGAFILIAKTGKRHVITRTEGVILCMLYAVYVGTITLLVK